MTRMAASGARVWAILRARAQGRRAGSRRAPAPPEPPDLAPPRALRGRRPAVGRARRRACGPADIGGSRDLAVCDHGGRLPIWQSSSTKTAKRHEDCQIGSLSLCELAVFLHGLS